MNKRGFLYLLIVLICSFGSINPGFGQTNVTDNQKSTPPPVIRQTGFYNVTTFIPVTFNGQFLSGIQTICGYRINSHLAVGGGIGYERFTSLLTYENFKADMNLLPVFADIRYTFFDQRFSPVVAVDGGYKFMLKKAVTQNRIDTTLGNIDGISSRTDYLDNNVFSQGGFFFTAEGGVRAKVSKKVALFLSVDYSLWQVSGDYYLTSQNDILGSDGWVLSNPVTTTENSIAYVNIFFVRLGIAF
ncbi:MAG: hypothetical protein ABSD71_04845 [Bacteroidales bacterium]|jgi:hypothetical protein